MKNLFLLFIAVTLPLFVHSQTAMTLDQMSENQIDQILNHSKKAVFHCKRSIERGQDLPQEQYVDEVFTLIYDYTNGGCDFYVKGESYAYFLSRPMNAQKKYIDKDGYHMLAYKFNKTGNTYLAFNLFTYNGKPQNPQMTWYINDNAYNNYVITLVDFYDTSGQLIASSYAPFFAPDIDTGNLLQGWLEKAYLRYK